MYICILFGSFSFTLENVDSGAFSTRYRTVPILYVFHIHNCLPFPIVNMYIFFGMFIINRVFGTSGYSFSLDGHGRGVV